MSEQRPMLTYLGFDFYPLNLEVETVKLVDIAHALSNICRFGGHVSTFYSVAQHSVLVSEHCEDSIWGLFHDAAEAYIGDMISPIKREFNDFRLMEVKCLDKIAEYLGLSLPVPDEVIQMDLRMLQTER